MKKIKIFLLIIISGLFILPKAVFADTIYDVSMDVVIDEYGTASVEEKWNVKADSGSEWYKQYKNLQNIEVQDFQVLMDGKELTQKSWNVDEGISAKAGYYGINHIADGLELCFGKSDYDNHVFTLKYKLTNFVFNTSDAQVVYFTLFPRVTTNKFSVKVSSFYEFPDTIDVWGYGYKGYAYVKDGVIEMSNEETTSLYDDYVVLLAKFPEGTFKTENSYEAFPTFDDVLANAKEGSYEYDYGETGNNNSALVDFIIGIFSVLLTFLPWAIIAGVIAWASKKTKYGYVNNKKITKDNTNLFREIPCNKDIYFANALIKVNEFGYKETNILGAIILKWVREDKITFKNEKKGVFNKETSSIDMTKDNSFDSNAEAELFSMMRAASGDGILETKELEKWCKKHYSKFLNVFNKFVNNELDKLKAEGHIYIRQNKEECKYKNVLDDYIYEESKKLYGLKLFFKEFTSMDTKEVMEVKLWDQYLMFAYLFGMADKVAKQLKNLYPKELKALEDQGIDLGTIIYINNLSSMSVHAATAARAAAQSYSGGGGGFSSGGGGGGSFGGGGGGSMGGR